MEHERGPKVQVWLAHLSSGSWSTTGQTFGLESTRSLPPNLTILLTQVFYLHWIDGEILICLD